MPSQQHQAQCRHGNGRMGTSPRAGACAHLQSLTDAQGLGGDGGFTPSNPTMASAEQSQHMVTAQPHHTVTAHDHSTHTAHA